MSSFFRQPISARIERRNQDPRSLRFFVFAIFCILFFVTYLVSSVGSIVVPVGKYTIEKGYTISTLNDKLGFGVASWRYRLWIRFFAPTGIIANAGTYETMSPTTVSDFLTRTIRSPLYVDQTITILPGWNMYDIDAYLANKGIGSVGDLLETSHLNFSEYSRDFVFLAGARSLEGYLYPDTYRLRPDATTDDAIRVMLREFDKKIGASYAAEGKDAYKKLILASIVEREERDDANQPIVAGILEKRVREGIAMGADATVCIGYAKTQKQCTPAFVATVIQDANPYNTRRTQGYPPTPIANVPLPAWNAATQPESSPYYYYLHGSDGTIHYGRTNQEHAVNKIKYLQ